MNLRLSNSDSNLFFKLVFLKEKLKKKNKERNQLRKRRDISLPLKSNSNVEDKLDRFKKKFGGG